MTDVDCSTCEGGYVAQRGRRQLVDAVRRRSSTPPDADRHAGAGARPRAQPLLPAAPLSRPVPHASGSTERIVSYDAYDLLVEETRDALGNRVTAGERDADPTQPLVRGHDYRVLQPALVMDPNRNRAAVAFDALGMVVGTAVMGKPEERPGPGDGSTASTRTVRRGRSPAYLADPLADPHAAARPGDHAARLRPDRLSPDARPGRAAAAVVASRSPRDPRHRPAAGELTQDPAQLLLLRRLRPRDPAQGPRRAGPGGRGRPGGRPALGRQRLDDLQQQGQAGPPVRAVLHRHAPLRVRPARRRQPGAAATTRSSGSVATLHPNHTWEKVVFDPWRQETLGRQRHRAVADPAPDPDVGGLLRPPPGGRLPADLARPASGRRRSAPSGAGRRARRPSRPRRHPVGDAPRPARPHFLTVAHNRVRCAADAARSRRRCDPPASCSTSRATSAASSTRWGASSCATTTTCSATAIHQASMEAGERWMLGDVTGQAALRLGQPRPSAAHRLRRAAPPDRGPSARPATAPELLVSARSTARGAGRARPPTCAARSYRAFDDAGVVTTDRLRLQGQPDRSSRRHSAADTRTTLDWSGTVPLEPTTYASTHDATTPSIGRRQLTTPDSSTHRRRPTTRPACWSASTAASARPPARPSSPRSTTTPSGRRTASNYGNGAQTTYAYDRRPSAWRGCSRGTTGGFPRRLPAAAAPAGPAATCRDLQLHLRPGRQHHAHPRRRAAGDLLPQPAGRAEHRLHLRRRLPADRGHRPRARRPGHAQLLDDRPARRPGAAPGDGMAMGRYLERYVYDAVGNLLEMQHAAATPATPAGRGRTPTRSRACSRPGGRATGSRARPSADHCRVQHRRRRLRRPRQHAAACPNST